MTDGAGTTAEPLSPIDFHILLALSRRPTYGYQLMKAIARDSDGAVAPQIGSLYRSLAKLVERGWVAEVDAPGDAPENHRGRPRRYYAPTPLGARVVRAEARRLHRIADLAVGLLD